MNDRTKESLEEIHLMSNVVVTNLLQEVREHIGCFYKLAESISMIDMLASFAYVCTLSEYVRPEFTDTLAVKENRHPILEKICADVPIPNNIFASEENNFIIITGPNMSGKSTYLKQIALSQIMAQMGSFIPATYASFRLADQIFSRIGNDGNIEANASTFMIEMRDMNYILQNASNNSLIIIDELGRGTSIEEGVGICHALCEYLLNLKAFTFFATHFMDITRLEDLYSVVENHYFEATKKSSEDGTETLLCYTHELIKGVFTYQNYGIQLAKVSTLPEKVIQDAQEIIQLINNNKKVTTRSSLKSIQHMAKLHLASRLLQAAKNSQLDEDNLRKYLIHLKTQYEESIQI